MLNNMRPAYATVGQNSSASNQAQTNYATFSAAQTEDSDFGAFGSDTAAKSAAPKTKPSGSSHKSPQKPRKKKSSGISSKSIIITVAVIAALVLVIALFAAVFSSPGKNILSKDDVYATYVDSNEVYHVIYNGSEVRHSFEGKVTLISAKDNSFAYVFEEVVSDEGTNVINMYILNGKKLTAIEGNADSIISCAEYAPGIIFKKGDVIQFHSNREFESLSRNPGASNFYISGDATTIVFTEPTRSANAEETSTQIKYFRDAGFNNIGETAGLLPVAISMDGKYVYATDSTGSFYYLKVTKRGEEFEQKTILTAGSTIFERVTELNATGTEVIFTVNTSTGTLGSAIYKIGDKKVSSIAAGAFRYTPIDKEVVCPATFVDAAFTVDRTVTSEEGETLNVTSTYYYTGKNAYKLADSEGTFSPDGKYFYYLDYEKLYRVELDTKQLESGEKQEITTANEFLITEKGDIYTYVLNDNNSYGDIRWRSADKPSSKRISTGADANSMYLCGNSIYFSETVNGDVKLYKSTNGAVKEEVTFKKTIPTSSLTVIMGTKDKGYAYFIDSDGNTQLLYTANAKAFDVVSSCSFCTVNNVASGSAATTNPGTQQTGGNTNKEESLG